MKKVKDFGYASILKFMGFKFLGLEWDGSTAYWLFEDDEYKAEDIIKSYVNGEIEGNIKKFVETQRTIKETLN